MVIGAVLLLIIALPGRSARWRGAIDRPRVLLLAGALGAMSAPFHFFFFPAVLLLSLAYVIAAGRLTDQAAPRNALALLGPYVLSIPFVLPPLLTAAGADRFQLRLWWDAPVAEGPLGVAFFYASNLGVPFLLALAALVWRGLPARRFLVLWIVAMFAIPNVATFSHITFDMNKYFQVLWMATAVAAGWFIRTWHPAAIALVIAASVASPIQVGVYGVATRYQVLGAADLRAADWARTASDPGSVFVTNGWLHAFTDVAGRLRVHSFGPYIQNIGYDPGPREAAVTAIYCGGDAAESARLVRSLGAQYVVESSRPEGCEAPVRFEDPSFRLVFEDAGLRIWEVAD
jgi:voltage-gated potassium channel Kch